MKRTPFTGKEPAPHSQAIPHRSSFAISPCLTACRISISAIKVVVTAAGALNAKHIIHAVAVDTDLKASERTISDATENSLLAAEELGLESIVFPPLGTILGGVLVTDSVRVMVNKVKEHVDKPTSLKLVIFGVACPSMQEIGYKAFRDEVKQLKKNREGIETRTKIEEAINEIKKFFRWTAGVELVDVRERIVKLKIESTCPSCLPPQEILKEVEKLLREYVPEIERVDLVQ